MIILAASVVITLSNTGIIDKANQAKELASAAEVQALATNIWTELYIDGYRDEGLKGEVVLKLDEAGVSTNKWYIKVSNFGVNVAEKSKLTLGDMIIDALDYGQTVNYVSDNGIDKWKVLYKTNENIYLIASEKMEYDKFPRDLITTSGAGISGKEIMLEDGWTKNVAQVYWSKAPSVPATVQNPGMWMANWSDYTSLDNLKCIAYFLDETYWMGLRNSTATYSGYIKGAIGTPTLEMVVASWNERRNKMNDNTIYNISLNLVAGEYGYYINDSASNVKDSKYQLITTQDKLYIWNVNTSSSIWLASPSAASTESIVKLGYSGGMNHNTYTEYHYGVRPVVCISAKCPAQLGTTTDIAI